jgi:hypothetical protein
MYLFNHRKKRKKIKDFLKNKIIESNLFFFESLKQDIPTPCVITDNTNYNFLKKNNHQSLLRYKSAPCKKQHF